MRVVVTYADGSTWSGDLVAYALLPRAAWEHTRVRFEHVGRGGAA